MYYGVPHPLGYPFRGEKSNMSVCDKACRETGKSFLVPKEQMKTER